MPRAGLFGSGPHAAVFRYDLVFLFVYALAFFGAYLLARELGLGPGGAVVAGAAFAFAPFRLEQDGHMQVISSGGIPLALALGVRGYRLRRPAWVVAGSVVAAWQLSISFTPRPAVRLPACGERADRGDRLVAARSPRLDRGLAIATVAGAILFAAAGFALSRPYVRVADTHSGARRTPTTVEAYSGPPWIFLVAPEENLVWGGATASLRDGLSNLPEKTLFPGLVIVVLALRAWPHPRTRAGCVGGWASVWSWSRSSPWDSGRAAGCCGRIAWSTRSLPGWQAIRVPGRLVTFSSLGLALLAGAGAQRAMAAAAPRRARGLGGPRGGRRCWRWRSRSRGGASRSIRFTTEPSPPCPRSRRRRRRFRRRSSTCPRSGRRTTGATSCGRPTAFPKLVNGRSSLNPTFTQRLIEDVQGFPSRRTVELLARTGVRSVVLHADRTEGTPWQGAARRPVGGLPVTRTRRDGLGDLRAQVAPALRHSAIVQGSGHAAPRPPAGARRSARSRGGTSGEGAPACCRARPRT